jgi:hypothetical protein
MTDKLQELEKKMDQLLIEQSTDKVTEKNRWEPKKLKTLHKKSLKKPEYVLVQYLRNNYTMDFQLCKIISGNIIVIDNKGHKLNPRRVWRHGKYFWYIIRECDTEAVSNNDADKLKHLQRSTDNHPILMKMVLGAIQKKEDIKAKLPIGWIIGVAVVGIIAYMVFGGK